MNAIDLMILEYEASVEADEAERQRQLALMLEKGEGLARAALPGYFGEEIWAVLSSRTTLKERRREDHRVKCEFWVECGDLGMTGFHVYVLAAMNGQVEIRRYREPNLDWGAFFKSLRADYHDKQVREACWMLQGAESTATADNALKQLLNLGAESAEAWQKVYLERIKVLEDQRKEDEAAKAYEAAYRAYLAETQALKLQYEMVLEALQLDLNGAREAWELEYEAGAIMNNEGEVEYVGTESVLVSTDRPVGGYWDEMDHGEWVKRKYISPIRLTPLMVSPKEGGRWPFGRLYTPGGNLYFWPEDRELAKKLLEKTHWGKLPEEPETPAELSEDREREIRYKVSYEMSEGEEQQE